MKKTIYLLFFCSYLALKAQQSNTLSVEYSFYTSLGGRVIQERTELKCSNTQSIFQYSLQNKMSNQVDRINDETIAINLKSPDTYYIFDLSKNVFTFTNNINGKLYKVNEGVPTMKWVLSEKSEDTKKINGFLCNKATLNFRGRNYIAWYSPKIPLPFGPWKFSRLPGLVLEIYDTENIYRWSAVKIVYPSKDKFDFKPIEQIKGIGITLKEFVEKYEESIKTKQDIILGRLPRDIKLESVTLTRESIELLYEWENKKYIKN